MKGSWSQFTLAWVEEIIVGRMQRSKAAAGSKSARDDLLSETTTGIGSQQQLGVSGCGSTGFAGALAGSTGQQQQLTAGCSLSSACAVGSQQHQPIGSANRRLKKCTRIRDVQIFIALLLFASNQGTVKGKHQ